MAESRDSLQETAAERDLFLYFLTKQTYGSVADTTLSAFAQLAALRLKSQRAFISLVDRTSQHILIEATQDSCLAANAEGLLFGRTTLARSQGLCGHALDVLSPEKVGLYQRASTQKPLVVNDLAADDRFKHCAFSTSHPSVRFYAAVSINTKSGFSIGTLSVMAEEPREGLTDIDTELLMDLAHAIAAHLEMTKSNEGHRRSEKMIKGLGMFMQGRTDLGDWWLDLGKNKSQLQQEPEDIILESSEPQNASPVYPVLPVHNSSVDSDAMASVSTVSVSEAMASNAQAPRADGYDLTDTPPVLSINGQRNGYPILGHQRASDSIPRVSRVTETAATIPPERQESIISKGLKRLFSRACHIIQDSIEVDGAIFLDASITTLSEHHAAQAQDMEEKACAVLGFCTGANSSMHGEMASTLKPLSENFLQGLFHKYPQGHVFSRGADAIHPVQPSDDEAAEAEEKALLQMLPGTRSIAFIPLWDSHRERWFAGSFMWTVDRTTRLLTHSEDLHYLDAFGNCIMAEVARLDVVGADRAKSDFISSISHELRSPLHGILASVELLQDTAVDSFQHAMIDTIERCGRTLLDTIQHVLDFSKINSFTKFKVAERAIGGPSLPRRTSGLRVDVDLSLLTEDIVDSVFAGHEFQGNSSLVVTDEASGYPPEGLRRSDGVRESTQAKHTSLKAQIDVVMDIGWRPNWVFSTESGAVRRVLMNLFGNALKYTESGWVKVSLHAKDLKSTPSQPQQSVITITVRDTGRGISQDYFHSGLFTPFTQEDSMNSGTGLGLSIVLQIVRSLGGTIDITSEQGVGTEVVVTLTLDQAALPGAGSVMIQNARRLTTGLSVGLVGLGKGLDGFQGRSKNGKPQSEPALFLQASIEGSATQWFDMSMAAPTAVPDIIITNGVSDLPERLSRVPVIVLCSHEALFQEYGERMARGAQFDSQGIVHFVSKPCGPHKLAKAFTYCLNKPLPQEPLLDILTPPGSIFAKSPEERAFNRMGHYTPNDYFHTGMASTPVLVTPPSIADGVPLKQKPMLLLVDDNKINLQLLSTFVRKSGYKYDTAENGLLALQAVQTAHIPYDVVFMDISMPVMDGLAATRAIRKHERIQGQRPCTIIALTGLGSADSQQEAISSGIDRFLTKPVRLNHLRSILSEWTPSLVAEKWQA